jgi:uncharacterized protein involved in outer membrane biogenesis
MKRPSRRRAGRRFRFAAWTLVLLLLAAVVAGAAYLALADLRPLVERLASAAVGRPVSIARLDVTFGRTTKLEIEDLRIANASWGSAPDMIRIGSLAADIYLPELLHGVLHYDRLSADEVQVLLERRNDGSRNWRFGEGGASAPDQAGLALIPKNRRQFPDIEALSLEGLTVVYRSEGRKDIRVTLDNADLGAPDATTPARLSASGAYNDIPVQLLLFGGTYAEMRDASKPFPATFSATSGAVKLVFDGGVQKPLDFDGVKGRLDFDVENFADFLKLFGYERPLNFPVKLASRMTRDGDLWRLAETKGSFKDSNLTGEFRFEEGGHGEPDAAGVDVTLDQFDIQTLVEGVAEPNATGDGAAFRPEEHPATTLDARIAAGRVTYGSVRVDDFRLSGRMVPGEIAADALNLDFAGGHVEAQAVVRAAGEDGAAKLHVAYSGGDAARLAAMAGLEDGTVAGKLDGRLSLALTGPTLDEALAQSDGQAVVAMTGGELARSLLEKVSIDLLALFRRNEGTASIQCLLGVAEIKDGNARISPLALRTADGRLFGAGALDMPSGQIDLMLRSDPDSTGALALDLPLHVTGPLDDPSVSPQLGGAPDWLKQAPELPPGLDPPGRTLAEKTGCAG